MKTRLTHARLKELLEYDPITGGFTWRIKRQGVVSAKKSVAGCLSAHSGRFYSRICIDGVLYHAHRLAWFYEYGEWPGRIDHKSGDGLENALTNLRPCSQTENLANSRRRTDNSSGLKGVTKSRGCASWKAQICINKKNEYIGSYRTKQEAGRAYDIKALQYFGSFARTNASMGLLD